MTKSPASFPVALLAALKAANVSQAELARRVGCSRAAVTQYASGDRVPSRDVVDRINAVLGTNLAPERPITVKEMARDVGAGEDKIRDGFKGGQLSMLGAAIPSKSGKRHRIIMGIIYLIPHPPPSGIRPKTRDSAGF